MPAVLPSVCALFYLTALCLHLLDPLVSSFFDWSRTLSWVEVSPSVQGDLPGLDFPTTQTLVQNQFVNCKYYTNVRVLVSRFLVGDADEGLTPPGRH